MVFHNMEELHMTDLKAPGKSMDTNLLNSPQESGQKNIDPYPSPSLLVNLESIML